MKRLLLLIDFQEGFLNPHTVPLRGRIQSLVRSSLFETVIATRFINEPGGPWRTVLQWGGLQSSDEQRLAVVLGPNAHAYDKSTYQIPKPLVDEIVAQWPMGSVFLAGIESDVCVAISAAQLFDAHVAPYVIADCTGTTKGPEHQEHALLTLGRIVGRHRVIEEAAIQSLPG